MQSPWDSSIYGIHQREYDDPPSERSTSAPAAESSFLFNRPEALGAPMGTYLGGNAAMATASNNWSYPFDSSTSGESTMHSLFPESTMSKGRADVPHSYESSPRGFPSSFSTGPSKAISPSFSGGHNTPFGSIAPFDSIDRFAVRDNGSRSHLAAPALEGHFSMGGPPGLHHADALSGSTHTSGNQYLDQAMDNSRIFQLEQKRSTSAGAVLGSQDASSNMFSSLGISSDDNAAARPASMTFMDLFQDDFPPESTRSANGYGGSTPRDNIYMDRPGTTSPLSQHAREFVYDEMTAPRDDPLSGSFERLRINQGDRYGSQRSTQLSASHRGGSPQGDSNHPSMYTPVAQAARSPSQTMLQQAQYEQQGFAGQQQKTVYVNPSHHYGYGAVPYHPQAQQHHHIVHQVTGHGEQYISVVPLQGNGSQVGAVNSTGTYAYFQPEGQPGAHPTYTIVNTHGPGGVPVAIARVGSGSTEPQRHTQSAGRGKEKGGRGRRGGTRRGGDQKHQSSSVGSPLLEEFKARKNRDWTVLDVKDHVMEFCQDQNGSRFMQQRLQIGDSAEKEIVMAEVLPAVRRLRNDVFGNYVVQKLLEYGTPKMKEDLRDTLRGEMLQLSLQMYGCRVVQKALETLDNADLPALLKEFHHHVLSCIHDQNGNHVIQKCIEVMSAKAKTARDAGDEAEAVYFNEQIDFIVDDVLDNVQALACHPYGCRVLQRILEHSPEPKKSKALDEISKCHKTLLDDQYGNYVIQHVLQFGRNSDRDSILGIVVSNGLLILSRQKFASNVVEKLLKYGNNEQRKQVVREMLKVADDHTGEKLPDGAEGTSVVLLMVRDAYANYVVQTTLDVIAEGEEKRLLMEELNSHSVELKNYTFAKHIVAKLGA